MNIANDTIVMFSGVSCVGKTTTAYEIIKKYPQFRRVSELDILRTIVRTAYEQIVIEEKLGNDRIMEKYKTLFASLTNSDFETAKLQSVLLIPYVREIILRQQRRRIPTIIEGAGIIPSTFFPDDKPLSWLTDSVILINLYLSDENQHVVRRSSRSLERSNHEDVEETRQLVSRARTRKNQELHMDTVRLSNIYPNVLSIDTINKSPQILADTIMEFISDYFRKKSNA